MLSLVLFLTVGGLWTLAPFAVFGLETLWLWNRKAQIEYFAWIRRAWDGSACPKCGYSMAGISTSVCPECGTDAVKYIRSIERFQAGKESEPD